MRFVWVMIVVVSLVSGCGSDTNTPKPSAPARTYTVSGKVQNLRAGAMLILQNNGRDNLTIGEKNTEFSFATKFVAGESYNVTVRNQLGQRCSVKNGAGAIAVADVQDVIVECSKKDSAQLANERNEFTSILQLGGGFVALGDAKKKESVDADPTLDCVNKIEFRKELRLLNEKIKMERLNGSAVDKKRTNDLPTKLEQKAIFMALAELRKCKKSGDSWRGANYSLDVVSLVDKSYSDWFSVLVQLYARKIGYADYSQRNIAIHKRFALDVTEAIHKIHEQQTAAQIEAQRIKELELQAAEKQQQDEKLVEKQRLEASTKKLEEERKKVIEEQRIADLAVKQEDLMLQTEAQRVKDLEAQKKKFIEQEKQFQPLYQRQKFERLK